MSLRLFIGPAMFELELERTVGERGGGKGREKDENLHSPTPIPLFIFDRRPPP